MTENINLDPSRVRSAMSRAESEIAAAKRNEKAALMARAKAAKLAEVWGFSIVNDVPCLPEGGTMERAPDGRIEVRDAEGRVIGRQG